MGCEDTKNNPLYPIPIMNLSVRVILSIAKNENTKGKHSAVSTHQNITILTFCLFSLPGKLFAVIKCFKQVLEF